MFCAHAVICALGRLLGMRYNSPRNYTMTDPASAIKGEVHQLVDLQIQTLRQPSCLTTFDLLDYRVRSKKLTVLYHELDQIRRASFKGQLRRAS